MSIKKNGVRNFINVKVAKLSNNKYNSIFFNRLHEDWEITLNIRWHLDINASFEFLWIRSWISDLHKVNFLNVVSSLFLTEAENTILVWGIISNRDINEASSVSFNQLLLTLLCEVQLHLSIDSSLVIRIKTNEEAPFLWRINTIWHDLTISHLRRSMNIDYFLKSYFSKILAGASWFVMSTW